MKLLLYFGISKLASSMGFFNELSLNWHLGDVGASEMLQLTMHLVDAFNLVNSQATIFLFPEDV